MDNLARKVEARSDEILGRQGVVRAKDGGKWTVTVGGVDVVARRAAGCLLEPGVGDTVLVGSGDAPSGEERTWVLTVLDRAECLSGARSSEISVDGDLRLRTAHGKVAIVAQDGIELISPATTSVVSGSLEVRARTASALVEGMELAGSWLRTEVDKVKVFAQSLDQVVDRFSQRSKRSYREVTDFDQHKAGSAHHRVEKTLRIHSGDAAVTADGIVKLDGKQIHVG